MAAPVRCGGHVRGIAANLLETGTRRMTPTAPSRRWLAVAVAALCFIAYSANGREIPSADSQAAKFTVVMLARRHALTLDGVVGRQPGYAERLAFQQDRTGRWRNAYPLPPVLEGAAVATVARGIGAVQLDAPMAPATIAKLTASLLASLAAMFAFLIARRFGGTGAAALTAIGFGLGTGIWPVASQTLWQHATVIWSVMAAIWLWTWPGGLRGWWRYALLGLLLGWAISARPQTGPMIGLLLCGMLFRATPAERVACVLALALPVTIFAGLNLRWFGHVFGTAAQLEQVSLEVHRVRHTWQSPVAGLMGLLFSPSRGLLVFSPIVLVVLAARPAPAGRWILGWTIAAASAQLLVYSSFSVWWGGHTYGPRYVLDLLPALVPAAAIGMARIANARGYVRVLAGSALAWSIAIAATGAFCYPHDAWNTEPVSVDRAHERVWEIRDSQIARCWSRGLSPQNFALFDRAAWRRVGN